MKTGAAEMGSHLYSDKDAGYFACARTEIESLLPKANGKPLRALEIGCSGGHTLEWLKRTGTIGWSAGVEPFAEVCQADRLIDQFFKLNIEQALPDLPPASIDLLLCLDVLEHLVDPWQAVHKLDALLKPGGQMIISLPNIRNYHILVDLAFGGKFNYGDSGILDKTHLRFFTRQTAIELAQCAGATVTHVMGTEVGRWQKRMLTALGLGDLLAKQFLLSAMKPSPTRAAAVVAPPT